MSVLCFYKYKLLLQYGDLEKYIHIISDNKHIIQTKIKKNKTNISFTICPSLTFGL